LGEADAVPVLIALLGTLPAAQAWQAEEALRRLGGEQGPVLTLGTDEAGRRKCQEAWERWWRDHDGPTLLAQFRRWTPQDFDRDKILTLVRQLGDDDFHVRDQATAALIRLRRAALPFLQQAAKDPDAEVKARVSLCLQSLDKGPEPALATSARLLVLRKPPGTAEALLAY